MAFLKTILIILLVYYLLKILARWFAPKIFSYAAKKTEERFRENFGGFSQQTQTNEEKVGDVIIDKKPSKKPSSSKKVGEYIEFEELD
ncbi:DUF4834 family protein [Maribacter sp. TH_r10]|uniref:DUF4834 family protein n=1 Tax=Maribacter luteus TaxID=2594478 RepID=A0A6I2MP62_9FLAO|nr:MULTISPECIES: DUF4834 family protein [Maribacter]MDV7140492.1 DUF4834 family protein [Maribacter sp. TH_r10]MRX64637.1 DUF4834 family protein [Maribacter luteus]